MNQLTIAKRVEGVGIGLHKGEPIKIALEPLEADMGIIFYRSDLGVSFKANHANVVNTQMATVIGSKDGFVSTIEHLMSAISSYGIDNMRIVLNANEIPVMDGSAISFCLLLDEAGICELCKPKRVLKIKKLVEVRADNKFVRIEPDTNLKLDYTIKFDNPIIGTQRFVFEFSKKTYIEQIAKARTFGFLKDVQALRAMNLGLGGSLDNAVVLDENKILNPEGLRYEDEFVRHKILDAIGDLALLGAPVIGKYTAFAGSHDLNHKLTLSILANNANYEEIALSNEFAKIYAKALA